MANNSEALQHATRTVAVGILTALAIALLATYVTEHPSIVSEFWLAVWSDEAANFAQVAAAFLGMIASCGIIFAAMQTRIMHATLADQGVWRRKEMSIRLMEMWNSHYSREVRLAVLLHSRMTPLERRTFFDKNVDLNSDDVGTIREKLKAILHGSNTSALTPEPEVVSNLFTGIVQCLNYLEIMAAARNSEAVDEELIVNGFKFIILPQHGMLGELIACYLSGRGAYPNLRKMLRDMKEIDALDGSNVKSIRDQLDLAIGSDYKEDLLLIEASRDQAHFVRRSMTEPGSCTDCRSPASLAITAKVNTKGGMVPELRNAGWPVCQISTPESECPAR